MEGFINLVNRLGQDSVDSVVSAATCAFAFVYLHPFEDGNGRLHRLIIHYLLTRTGFSPHGIIFPVSSVMLAELRDYDDCLESFSKQLLPLIDFDLHDDGELTVNNQTADHYKYFDATKMAEYLYAVIEKTIEVDLVNELEFISHYDLAKSEIKEIVDMPDNKIDLFIKLSLDNHGALSKTKRKNFFSFLTDTEVTKLEEIIKKTFAPLKD
jgi:Fic family protein